MKQVGATGRSPYRLRLRNVLVADTRASATRTSANYILRISNIDHAVSVYNLFRIVMQKIS